MNKDTTNVDFSKEKNPKYKQLLQAEYRVIKSRQDLIRKNARIIYERKTDPKDNSALSKRCNDFLLCKIAVFLHFHSSKVRACHQVHREKYAVFVGSP